MTAIPRTVTTWRPRSLAGLRAIARGRTDEPAWVRGAFVGVVALAAVLFTWNLAISAYANTYYSAAALAASRSWSAFFFGSFDAANFITVDKPPAAIWLMGLSVRLFGLSSWSVLLPEALAGVATVGILFAAVRRSFGPVAAVIAGLVMALTPAAVLIFRFNNPDALLTLLLVAGAWALLRAIEHGGLRWVTLAAACVGVAFLTKYLQAYLVLPGFALVYLVAANASFRRRIAGLGVAAVAVALASGWWVAIVALIPASSRPFIGGSTTGSVLDLIFGYDGLGRIFGAAAGGTGNSTPFGGTAGLLRLFNDAWFGEIAWFIPPALASLGLGLWLRRRAARTDPARAGYLLWGTWLVSTGLVFSFMSGTSIPITPSRSRRRSPRSSAPGSSSSGSFAAGTSLPARPSGPPSSARPGSGGCCSRGRPTSRLASARSPSPSRPRRLSSCSSRRSRAFAPPQDIGLVPRRRSAWSPRCSRRPRTR